MEAYNQADYEYLERRHKAEWETLNIFGTILNSHVSVYKEIEREQDGTSFKKNNDGSYILKTIRITDALRAKLQRAIDVRNEKMGFLESLRSIKP